MSPVMWRNGFWTQRWDTWLPGRIGFLTSCRTSPNPSPAYHWVVVRLSKMNLKKCGSLLRMKPTDISVGFGRCSEDIGIPSCWGRTGNMDKRQSHEEVAFKPTLENI